MVCRTERSIQKFSGLRKLSGLQGIEAINNSRGMTNFLLAENVGIDYRSVMSILLRQLARYVVQKAASDPEVKEKMVKAARGVVAEIKQVAKEDNRAHAAGKAFRRTYEKLRSNR